MECELCKLIAIAILLFFSLIFIIVYEILITTGNDKKGKNNKKNQKPNQKMKDNKKIDYRIVEEVHGNEEITYRVDKIDPVSTQEMGYLWWEKMKVYSSLSEAQEVVDKMRANDIQQEKTIDY